METLILGHGHLEKMAQSILDDEENGERIGRVFSRNDVQKYLENIKANNPNMRPEELKSYAINKLLEETEHFRSVDYH